MTAYSKFFDRIKVRPDPKVEAAKQAPRCQWDGCTEPGVHKAPVGRMREGEYFQFCIHHVKEYNKGYNYFSGLRDTDIARFQKEAMTGHRPTWTMGVNSAARSMPEVSTKRSGRAGYYNRVRDPFNLFNTGAAAGFKPPEKARKARPLEAKALETLGLAENATGDAIKARYKQLVKQHHPDANGGNRGSEDRFRDVIQAYRLLKQSGFC